MPGCMDDLRTVLSRLVLGAVVSAKKLARLFIALVPLPSDADWTVLFTIWGGVSSRRSCFDESFVYLVVVFFRFLFVLRAGYVLLIAPYFFLRKFLLTWLYCSGRSRGWS